MCRAFGFGLSLQQCRSCGSKGPMRGFDLESGSFICANCQIKNAQIFRGGGEIWGGLRFLDTCPLDISPRISVKSITGRRIEVLFLHYFQYHIPGLPTMESWKMLPPIYWGVETEE
jgi:recombinational DNA repair protein (RecF pathway)